MGIEKMRYLRQKGLYRRRAVIIEKRINQILRDEFFKILNDPNAMIKYQDLFDRSGEESVEEALVGKNVSELYGTKEGPKGEGETPLWDPNPAYMQALRDVWKPVEAYLSKIGLTTDFDLVTLFYLAREYEQEQTVHFRKFTPKLCKLGKSQKGYTGENPIYRMSLWIPHSHEEFELVTQPYVSIDMLI